MTSHRRVASCLLSLFLSVIPALLHAEGAPAPIDPWKNWVDDTPVFNSEVAATVNGIPILKGEVLNRYGNYLPALREQMRSKQKSPVDYAKTRENLLVRDLSVHVQRQIIAAGVAATATPEQFNGISQRLEALFEMEIKQLQKELKVADPIELDMELNRRGTSLKAMKREFVTQNMAGEYLAELTMGGLPLQRAEERLNELFREWKAAAVVETDYPVPSIETVPKSKPKLKETH